MKSMTNLTCGDCAEGTCKPIKRERQAIPGSETRECDHCGMWWGVRRNITASEPSEERFWRIGNRKK